MVFQTNVADGSNASSLKPRTDGVGVNEHVRVAGKGRDV